jgi:hypothetical protein
MKKIWRFIQQRPYAAITIVYIGIPTLAAMSKIGDVPWTLPLRIFAILAIAYVLGRLDHA